MLTEENMKNTIIMLTLLTSLTSLNANAFANSNETSSMLLFVPLAALVLPQSVLAGYGVSSLSGAGLLTTMGGGRKEAVNAIHNECQDFYQTGIISNTLKPLIEAVKEKNNDLSDEEAVDLLLSCIE
jgi:hypothetical protein